MKQGIMPGVVPPLSASQEAAMAYIDADRNAKRARELSKKKQDEMVATAMKAGLQTIKVKDEDGYVHTFDIQSKAQVAHRAYLEVKVERVEPEAEAAG